MPTRSLEAVRKRVAAFHRADYCTPARDYDQAVDDIEFLLKLVDRLMAASKGQPS